MSQDAVAHWLNTAGRHPLLTAAEEVHLGTMIRAWQDHPAGPAMAPAAVQRRGRRALDRMVAGNLRLVASIARIMRPALGCQVRDADVADLLQAGAMGLIRGAERFDPARGYKFSTFAYWWIRQGISRWCDSSSRAIRLPAQHAARLARIGKLSGKLAQQLGHTPTREDLAAALCMSMADLDLILQVGAPCASLNAQVSRADDPSYLGDFLATPAEPDDPQLDELRARVAALPEDWRRVVVAHWGLDGRPPQKLMALAAAEGLTISQLKERLRRASAQLRRAPPGKLLAEPIQLRLSLSAPIPPAPPQPRSGGARRGRRAG